MLRKKYCSVKEAAEFSSLSKRVLYKKLQNRELKFYRVGKRILIELQDLNDFIKQSAIEPADWRKLNK